MPILGITASSILKVSDTGAMFPLQSVTVGVNGASSISFNNIVSTYKHLQLRIFGRTNRSGNTQDTVSIRFNSDSGNNYSRHAMYGDGGGGSVLSDSSTSTNLIVVSRFSGSSAASSLYGSGIADILDYSDTSKNKVVKSLGGVDLNGSGEIYFASGSWMNTNAISSIQIISNTSSSFVEGSQFTLYGVKTS